MIPHTPTPGDIITRDELIRRAQAEVSQILRRLDEDLGRFAASRVETITLRDNRPFEAMEVVIGPGAVLPFCGRVG